MLSIYFSILCFILVSLVTSSVRIPPPRNATRPGRLTKTSSWQRISLISTKTSYTSKTSYFTRKTPLIISHLKTSTKTKLMPSLTYNKPHYTSYPKTVTTKISPSLTRTRPVIDPIGPTRILLPFPPFIRSGLPIKQAPPKVAYPPRLPWIEKREVNPSPTGMFGFPFCTDIVATPAIDPNGYQYGWDKETDESCIVNASPVSIPSPVPTSWLGFPVCNHTVDNPSYDEKGYQYGWDWRDSRSCIIYAPPTPPNRTTTRPKMPRGTMTTATTESTSGFTSYTSAYKSLPTSNPKKKSSTTSSKTRSSSLTSKKSSTKRATSSIMSTIWVEETSSSSKTKRSSSSKTKRSTTYLSTTSFASTTAKSTSKYSSSRRSRSSSGLSASVTSSSRAPKSTSRSRSSSTDESSSRTSFSRTFKSSSRSASRTIQSTSKPTISKITGRIAFLTLHAKKPTKTEMFGFIICTGSVTKPALDKNGYQYGFENGESCIVDAPPMPKPSAKPSVSRKDGFPVCTAPVEKPALDPQGKKYGFDSNLGESCIVADN